MKNQWMNVSENEDSINEYYSFVDSLPLRESNPSFLLCFVCLQRERCNDRFITNLSKEDLWKYLLSISKKLDPFSPNLRSLIETAK